MVFSGVAANLVGRARVDAETAATSDVLQQAKLSLLGYAARVTNGAGGNRLGNLPTPDILNTAGTGVLYDGFSDASNKCLGNTGTGLPGVGPSANKRCLGKFPVKDLPLALGITDVHDPAGKVPWLAISPNLDFWDSCLNILNSEVINFAYSTFNCPTLPATPSTTLPYPWLTVYDKDGVTPLSSRVAAILIMPGEAITTETRSQVRTISAPGLPTDYLDNIQVPLGCTGCVRTFDNAGLTNEFINIPAGTLYPADAQDVAKRGQPVKFNDVLVYITIDELIAFIEKRVLKDMASAVNELSGTAPKKNIGFPWAAPYISAPDSYAKFLSATGYVVGLFPFFVNRAPVSNEIPYPTYPSNLDWSITGMPGPTIRTCAQVQSTPTVRWINTRQRITATVAGTGTLTAANASCTWRDASKLTCGGTTVASPTALESFQQFSTLSNCNAGTPVATTVNYSRTRTSSLTADDASCSGILTNTYTAASNTQTQRWTWNCPTVQTGSLFTINVTESFATPIPVTGSFLFNAVGRPANISNMRYQPTMPYWFYQNEWYKLTFYALSPTIRPVPLAAHNCGSATSLTVGGAPLDNGLVILAGSKLTNPPAPPPAPSMQTRPSTNILDYMEPTAATDFANCIFKSPGISTSSSYPSSYNDRILPVQ